MPKQMEHEIKKSKLYFRRIAMQMLENSDPQYKIACQYIIDILTFWGTDKAEEAYLHYRTLHLEVIAKT